MIEKIERIERIGFNLYKPYNLLNPINFLRFGTWDLRFHYNVLESGLVLDIGY